MPRGVSLEGYSLDLKARGSSVLGPALPRPSVGLLEMALRFMGIFPTGKECDLNRQCGVINPETKKICTRLLTCKVISAPLHRVREDSTDVGPGQGEKLQCYPRFSSGAGGGGEAQVRQGGEEAAPSGASLEAVGRLPHSKRRFWAYGSWE